ncbi:MAG: N-acetylglucosamine kinase [Reichenbachiella sp.]
MKLIADSGSTKTDWRILDGNDILEISTPGINPNYMAAEQIAVTVREGFAALLGKEITEVFFYGAGCSSETNQSVVQQAIHQVYPKAKVRVTHDLLGATRALCGQERGIACILGTGSNSALYDGKEIVDNVTSMGYLLGDEGSGNHIGRALIKAYFKNKISAKVKQAFDDEFGLEPSEIISGIYRHKTPIQFIANFSKFVHTQLDDPSVYQLVYDCFKEFFEENVYYYSEYEKEPIHFVGSVAYHYQVVLRKVGADLQLNIKNIIRGPIEGLVLFHNRI